MKKNSTLIGTALLLTACFALPVTSLAQSGSLDLTFDTDGIVTTAIGTFHDVAHSVAIQPDGKIVVAGYRNNSSNEDFAVVRYNTNGSLDNTFDTDGIVTTAIGVSHERGHSVTIQTDGKIVVAGFSYNGTNNDFALVRYNTNGSLDNTFDTDGIVTTAIGTSNDIAYSVVIQPDGKIVVAGSNGYFDLVRYNTNGSLDNTFDTDGIITTAIGASDDGAFSLTIQSDGKIVVAGYNYNGANHDFALVRYNTNGSLDNTFDTDGIVTTAIGAGLDIVRSVAIQSDGKIVVAGYSNNGSNDDVALVRYNTNGSLDNTFDTDGIVTTAIGTSSDIAYSVVIQSDGKIVIAGISYIGSNNDFALVRYNTNGSLDNTFDTDGKVTTAIGTSSDIAHSIVIQADGKIVAAGFSFNGSNNDFALVRYNNCISSTFIQSPIICAGQSVSVGSNTYTVTGTYTDTLVGVNSCDSIVTTNLTVNPMPVLTTNVVGIVITADQSAATYQWIDCNNSNLPIAGQTNQSFTATVNGSYAVIVTLNSCSDTSACVNIVTVGISQLSANVSQLSIYPNPFSTSTTLQTNYLLKNATLTIHNLYGQEVKQINNISGQTVTISRDNLPSGLYFVYLIEDSKIKATDKLVITD